MKPTTDVVSTVKLPTDRGPISALRCGDPANVTFVLLHGWPQCKELYRSVLPDLAARFHVVAPDLPGIGGSRMDDAPTDKRAIAGLVLDAVEGIGERDVIVAGVDVGGTVAYAAARHHPGRVRGVAIMNTVVPGVDPWDRVLAEPQIWHFAFHATPGLPERMVAGRQRAYFDFFADFLSGDPSRISDDMREAFAAAYRRPDALRTGFGWYRSFTDDVRHNARRKRMDTPILYVRGDADGRSARPYLAGLRAAGATDVRAVTVDDCGELVALEQPAALVRALVEFADRIDPPESAPGAVAGPRRGSRSRPDEGAPSQRSNGAAAR